MSEHLLRSALRDLARALNDTAGGHRACYIDDHVPTVLAWSHEELAVRVTARGVDELWVTAGLALLIRLVADSEGGFDDLLEIVVGVLNGHAREYLRPESDETLVAVGYRLLLPGSKAEFVGGITDSTTKSVAVEGPFAALP